MPGRGDPCPGGSVTAMSRDAPIVVVGAGAAGLTVVESLRREGFGGPIVLVGDEGHLPYDRPPLSKGFLLGALEPSRLALRDAAAIEALGVELRLGRSARELDVTGRRLHLDDATEIAYDRLVVATGVRPRLPEGIPEHRGVRALRTIDDARAIRERMASSSRLLVVGGGLLGYEIAASARSAGLAVTVVDRGPHPLARQLGSTVGEMVARLHRARGVEVLTEATVRTIEGPPEAPSAILEDGRAIPADLVVAAVGSRPNAEWLDGSGLNIDDGVVCDAWGRAGDGVYAVGDVARWGTATGPGRRVEHRSNASEQAIAVARHMVHGVVPAPVAPYFWSDQYDVKIQVAGVVRGGVPMEVVAGDAQEDRFVMVAREGGAVAAVVGWRMPKEFAAHRARLSDGYLAA